MRLANGIIIDKEKTFGVLKFSALRRAQRFYHIVELIGIYRLIAGNRSLRIAAAAVAAYSV